MSDNVFRLPWVDADADVCLESLRGLLAGFVVAGYCKETGKLIVASSYANTETANLLADKLKRKLFEHMEA